MTSVGDNQVKDLCHVHSLFGYGEMPVQMIVSAHVYNRHCTMPKARNSPVTMKIKKTICGTIIISDSGCLWEIGIGFSDQQQIDI